MPTVCSVCSSSQQASIDGRLLSRREATGYARQAAASHVEAVRQRLAAALSATLD